MLFEIYDSDNDMFDIIPKIQIRGFKKTKDKKLATYAVYKKSLNGCYVKRHLLNRLRTISWDYLEYLQRQEDIHQQPRGAFILVYTIIMCR